MLNGRQVVLDVDDPKALEGYQLPETPTVKTARGSHHYFFTPEPVRTVKSASGLELRGRGSCVVLPPSIHPTGAVYEWEISPWDVEPAFLPRELLGHLIRPVVRHSPASGFWTRPPEEIVTAQRPCIKRLYDSYIPVGQRHNAMLRLVMDWRRQLEPEYAAPEAVFGQTRIVIGKCLEEVLVEWAWQRYKRMVEDGQRDGRREVTRLVESVLRYDRPPHRCDDPVLHKYCVGTEKCPFYRALGEKRLNGGPTELLASTEGLTARQIKICEAIIQLEEKYKEPPGSWVVCSQTRIGRLAGCTREWVNKTLPDMVKRGVIEMATGAKFEGLIREGEISVERPSGTAIRRLCRVASLQ